MASISVSLKARARVACYYGWQSEVLEFRQVSVMARLFFFPLPLLILALDAYAQTPEPPAEKASFATVLIFLVLFIGSCAGYVGYAWWNSRKKRDEEK